ncbi:programmed cell death protein 2 [Dichomitus squalens]|uniref:Programmed cell death protein 2 n=1 Tax=Dichomitus squalens TaxID=114155 RepID=A0A4Q9Q153_9APHY|nr:programmed cell death protein 2 [Dichomitus squalens]
MPHPDVDDTWSDSDEELEAADVETAVQLGIPDGPVDSVADLSDPTVSRIGGHPTFLAAPHPPLTQATCNNCSRPMELLVQIWCPLEDSPNDRALFVWGCANSNCQRKEGSIRAWRELRYNKKYAEKLERKQARLKKEAQQGKAAAEALAQKAQAKSNPFALGASSAPPTPFGLGSQIFGGSDPMPSSESSTVDSPQNQISERDGSPHSSESNSEDDDDGDDDGDDDALAAAVQSVALEDSPWKDAPAYSAQYLSTVSEYLPPTPKLKGPAGAIVDEDSERAPKDGGWGGEGYENSMEVDHAFERFSKRVSYEGEQCLRYELKGTPLPYASDKVFDMLFPLPPAPPLPVTKASFMVTPPRKRTYTPESLPACPHCKSRRVFECQLMPNLINVLRSGPNDAQATMTDEERRAEVLKVLKGQDAYGRREMEWGTCMIFSCEKDCAVHEVAGTTWREEYVLVQWDE